MEGQEEYITEEPILGIKDEVETPENELGEAGGDATTKSLTPWDQVKSEWDAPLEQRALLVRSMGTVTLSMVKLATTLARRYGVPISGVNIIPSKAGPRPYLNSDGIRWRLHMDERGLLAWSGRVFHMPSKEEPWIAAYGKAEMKDGTWADNESYKEWPITDPKDKDRSFNLGNMCKKLITQAKRRAGADLVGVGIPIYDEYYDEVGEIINGESRELDEPKRLKPKKTEPITLSDLLTMAKEVDEEVFETADGVEELMGMELTEMNNPETIKKTWERIQEKYGTGTEEETEVSEESEGESKEQVS